MRAIQFVGPRKIEMFDDYPIPEPKPGEVLVECKYISLCGSNMGQYTGEGVWSDIGYPYLVGHAGHENIGVIVKSTLPEWKEGDLVLAQPEGYYGFAEFIVAKPPAISKIPNDTADPAAMMVAQPLSTILRAMSQTDHVINHRCAVIGQGSMGLIWTHALRMLGAREVIAVDTLDWRLEWSKKFSADHVIDASKEDVIERVKEITGGEMLDFVVDAAGRPDSLATASLLPKRAGRLYVFGMPHFDDQVFPWYSVFRNETQIICTVGPECGDFFQISVDMVADSRASILTTMVTPRLPWAEAPEAFEMYANQAKDSMKLMLIL